MWKLRDWCFSGEKCQFIEQLLVWVGGGIAGIKQNDISAAASDDRLISSLLCVCYKNVLTHLSTYILRASSSWSFWKTHIEETGEQRKKESSVKIASGSRWKREIIIIIYIWKGKTWNIYLPFGMIIYWRCSPFRNNKARTEPLMMNVINFWVQKFLVSFYIQKSSHWFYISRIHCN